MAPHISDKNIFHIEAPLWLMSFFDRDSGMAVTPDGLRCQSRDPKAWQGVRCTKGVTGKGKYFFEATVSDEGLCRVGWSTPQVRGQAAWSPGSSKLKFLCLVDGYVINH